jgi:hypothetical protein
VGTRTNFSRVALATIDATVITNPTVKINAAAPTLPTQDLSERVVYDRLFDAVEERLP